MDKYSGCHASRNDRIRTQTNSLRKIKITFAQQLKKRRNSMCYKQCASALYFFMSSNRRNAPLKLVFSFCMQNLLMFWLSSKLHKKRNNIFKHVLKLPWVFCADLVK